MKEAIVNVDATVTVTIQETPIPKPGPHQVLVKVIVAGTNPKDWMFPKALSRAHNSGDDVAGIVEEVGSEVYEFHKGDRVAGMHCFPEPHGAFGEYAILLDYMTIRLPDGTSFEEAATIPLATLTAAFGLSWVLGLPMPWQRSPEGQTPLIVYGASTAVAAFGIQLARAANIHPIIAIGSSNSSFMTEYLDNEKGDCLIDYRVHKGPEALIKAIRSALTDAGIADGRALHAFDCVSQPGTYDAVLSKVLAGEPKNGHKPKVATVLPELNYSSMDPTVDFEQTYCGLAHEGTEDARRFGAALFRSLTQALKYGWFKGHPYEVVPGGLDGVEAAVKESKEGNIKAKKLILKIAEP
ncbi:Trans-enoyl reductase fsr4 [Cladobotryum mycophilum]|uniref:Trans-enoyl reductase fsr4 n=1 Tax=Cladobotryum mycophilum TaxID=491253 RepID=A0ABR0SU99_9HYPO